MAEHEEMVLDLAACVRFLKEKKGAERIVLLGNCGGGSLAAFYQAQARLSPEARLEKSPGGSSTHFGGATMTPADAMIYVAAHPGQGKVLLDAIDPSIVDEGDALSVDPTLDMYDPRNGFQPPPAPTRFDPAFLATYLAAQRARVERIDARARSLLAQHGDAARASAATDFEARPEEERRDVLRRQAFEPVFVVYRTMANPRFVDPHIDPSGRDYGSLMSERPDLMNYAALGFARTTTPRAWLSTWSGLSTNADLLANAARIAEPTLIVHAERDREIHPRDRDELFAACASTDKRVVTISDARHYFEPELGERTAPHVEALMDVVVPWIQERFA
jgi:fermentation-respiration switch protein FrsA (DUF1100 family)